MKILFCEMCRSAVSAPLRSGIVKRCECGKSAIWLDPNTNLTGVQAISPKAVSIICVADSLMASPFLAVSKEKPTEEYGVVDEPSMKRAVKACDKESIFARLKTLVVRIRPTFTAEIAFQTDPTKIPII